MSGDGKAALTISHCFWKGLEEISALQLCCRCVAWVSLFLKGRNKVDFPFNGNTAHVKSGLSRKGQWINDPRTATVPPPHGTRGASFNTDNYHHKSLQTSLPLATTCLSFPLWSYHHHHRQLLSRNRLICLSDFGSHSYQCHLYSFSVFFHPSFLQQT